MRVPTLALLVCLCAGLCLAQPPEAIFYNGRIVTEPSGKQRVAAVSVRNGRFLAAGSSEEVLATAGTNTQRIDLQGRMVLPGLIESHVHPITAALSEKDGSIPVMESIAEIQEFIRKEAARLPKERLIFVPKIYGTRLKEKRYPNRYELDAAAPGRLVMCDNSYAAVLSSPLLDRLGVSKESPEPPNGKIIRDEKGEPTGLVLGARNLLTEVLETRQYSHAEMADGLRRMQAEYNKAGLTSIIDRGQRPEGFRVYQDLERRGELTVRATVTYLVPGGGTPADIRAHIAALPITTGWGNEWLRAGPLKTIVDGGILIGTAYLRAPYGEHTEVYGYHDPDYRGVLNVSRENLVEMARTANELGWQMTSHVTGGGAIDLLLDAYEAADREQSIRGRRFTVTHGNFPDARAIERAASLGVAFDCQPAWLHFDGPALKPVFGPDRIRNFLPLKTMLKAGIVVAGGSDHMIRLDSRKSLNPYNPFFGMWMAITRKLVDGSVLNPEEAVSREEALRMWTLNGAWLTFEEKDKGSIAPGKLADFVVIDRDFFECPADEIQRIEALRTVVGGRTVWRAD